MASSLVVVVVIVVASCRLGAVTSLLMVLALASRLVAYWMSRCRLVAAVMQSGSLHQSQRPVRVSPGTSNWLSAALFVVALGVSCVELLAWRALGAHMATRVPRGAGFGVLNCDDTDWAQGKRRRLFVAPVRVVATCWRRLVSCVTLVIVQSPAAVNRWPYSRMRVILASRVGPVAVGAAAL